MVIVFHSNQIAERGTETAIIDYALANEEILNNISIISFPSYKILNTERYDYIKSRFQTIEYQEKKDLHALLVANKADLLYIIEDGEAYPDTVDLLPEKRPYKTFVHAVFSTKRKHGDFYCPISNYLNKAYHTHYPVLPHIVKTMFHTNSDLRKELSIPASATVYGCYGGKNSFSIKFAQDSVLKIAREDSTRYFIFMNIEPFTIEKIPNIIFLPGTTDPVFKEMFINTSDAMLHARADGETFGLSVGEFSIKNKPVITYKPSFMNRIKDWLRPFLGKRPIYATAHLENLKQKSITYSNSKQLISILQTDLTTAKQTCINYDCFSQKYSPQNVITIFNRIITGNYKGKQV